MTDSVFRQRINVHRSHGWVCAGERSRHAIVLQRPDPVHYCGVVTQ